MESLKSLILIKVGCLSLGPGEWAVRAWPRAVPAGWALPSPPPAAWERGSRPDQKQAMKAPSWALHEYNLQGKAMSCYSGPDPNGTDINGNLPAGCSKFWMGLPKRRAKGSAGNKQTYPISPVLMYISYFALTFISSPRSLL